MTAYYNEIDPKAAAWIRELIKAGHVAPGEVDERDIWDVHPSDLAGFNQVHLFAGIAVWSYSLRRAGWADDRAVWTMSCPCQPFSAAGAGKGFLDERHLWPAGFHLISECRPGVILGEQVANKTAEPWLDLVQTDLEGLGYAFGACAFPSAGVGAPHIRDRTYWVANASKPRPVDAREYDGRPPSFSARPTERGRDGRLADDDDEGLEGRRQPGRERAIERPAGAGGVAVGLADTDGRHPGAERQQRGREQRQQQEDGRSGGLAHSQERPVSDQPERLEPVYEGGTGVQFDADIGTASGNSGGGDPEGDRTSGSGSTVPHGHALGGPGPTNGLWRDADWLFCRDGKWRPVKPRSFPLAHGYPQRVGLLRGAGNAINAEAATVFIEAYLDTQTVEAGE